jgi:hypothetical protein
MAPAFVNNATLFSTFGSFALIVNAATGRSSTGIVAAHMAVLPPAPGANTAAALQQERALVWSRFISPAWEAANGTQAGMATSTAALFDAVTGAYTSAPMPQHAFSSGQSHLPDGSVLVMGGEEPGNAYPKAQVTWLQEGRQSVRVFNGADGLEGGKLRCACTVSSMTAAPAASPCSDHADVDHARGAAAVSALEGHPGGWCDCQRACKRGRRRAYRGVMAGQPS